MRCIYLPMPTLPYRISEMHTHQSEYSWSTWPKLHALAILISKDSFHWILNVSTSISVVFVTKFGQNTVFTTWEMHLKRRKSIFGIFNQDNSKLYLSSLGIFVIFKSSHSSRLRHSRFYWAVFTLFCMYAYCFQ